MAGAASSSGARDIANSPPDDVICEPRLPRPRSEERPHIDVRSIYIYLYNVKFKAIGLRSRSLDLTHPPKIDLGLKGSRQARRACRRGRLGRGYPCFRLYGMPATGGLRRLFE